MLSVCLQCGTALTNLRGLDAAVPASEQRASSSQTNGSGDVFAGAVSLDDRFVAIAA
jgi:hypothetical protein